VSGAAPSPFAPAEPSPFLAGGPLPGPGVTVIEASAGTGKTYTLTSLVLRYLAEGVPLSSVLAVTFTRMATGELRDRVRSRLVEAHRRLGLHLEAGGAGGSLDDDEVLLALAAGTIDEVGRRCQRIADALADFDAATIATTHGFCQLVLHGLGTAGATVPGVSLLEDPAELVDEVVYDLYVRWNLLHPAEEPAFTLDQARKAAVEAIRNPDAVLTPPGGDDPRGLLARLAGRARLEVDRRLLEGNLITYDHLLQRLATTLDDAERGALACRRLADRYQVVLVDEFQDTDPIQWTVLRRAFTAAGGGEGATAAGGGEGATRLVLIGDPKQAVYGFRGADVHAYLEAAASAQAFHTLGTNWRADQPLLDATDALLSPLRFGHADICFRPVRAPEAHREPRLIGGGDAAPMRWRLVDDLQRGVPVTTHNLLSKPPLVEWVAHDVAADVARLLSSGATLIEDGVSRPLVSRHVAVLTRNNRQALAVRDALRAAGVPSVVAGLDSVFRSEAADAWLRLLEALVEPSSRSRAAAVALGPFVGMSTRQAATAGEPLWEGLHDALHRWGVILAGHGVSAVYRAVTVERDLPGRLLSSPGGERQLTDLGHLAHLLHAEAAAGQLGAPSLRSWLAARIRAVADEQSEMEDRSRRLDSDAEAVQVLTIHRAKGLEFPVVYCPYLWDGGPPERAANPVLFHDPAEGGARTLDVGCPDRNGPARERYQRNAAIGREERRGEDLRLMYVALTRARHRLVLWWARTQDCRNSPLGRLLVGRDPLTGDVRDSKGREPNAKQVRAALDELIGRAAPGLITVESAGGFRAGSPTGSGPPEGPTAALAAASFTRVLDLRWRRSSYSSITAEVHGQPAHGEIVGSEPETGGTADEPAERVLPIPTSVPGVGGPPSGSGVGGAPSGSGAGPGVEAPPSDLGAGAAEPLRPPLAGLAPGADTGTLVHGVLESVDFTAADPAGAFAAAAIARAPALGVATAALIGAGLAAAVQTPLGPIVGGATLASVGRGDRIDELGFEMPVAGGDDPSGSLAVGAIAGVLDRWVGADHPLAGYPELLRDPLLDASLRGYMTGSLDLVFRRPGPDGTRWYVADYKTNWLGPPGRDLAVGDYRPGAMAAEMRRRHYPLQALIYTVALHRYLAWRVPGYTPEDHLGGVLYLFLRGMAGPSTPVVDGSPCGVWSWAVEPGLVRELSDLFDGGGGEGA
jgi:exodeoxyribonuclease V beta subunit